MLKHQQWDHLEAAAQLRRLRVLLLGGRADVAENLILTLAEHEVAGEALIGREHRRHALGILAL
jgi:hypothetical protein